MQKNTLFTDKKCFGADQTGTETEGEKNHTEFKKKKFQSVNKHDQDIFYNFFDNALTLVSISNTFKTIARIVTF